MFAFSRAVVRSIGPQDERTVVLADPTLTLGYFERCAVLGLDNVIFSDLGFMDERMQLEFRRSYEQIEAQLRRAGFRIHRIWT